MKTPTCHLCEAGFPLLENDRIPTQRLGMIPVLRCRKAITLLDIQRFRAFLNQSDHQPVWSNGRHHQITRPYGDYLFAQDRDKFMAELSEWLPESEVQP